MHTTTHPPADQRLALIDRARHAVLDAREAIPPAWLPPSIERSWRRCLARGLEPRQRVSFEPVTGSAMRHALESSQSLIQAATPVIQSLARTMAATQYFAILTNAQGVVINVNGPVDLHDPLARVIARMGVDLSEHAVGTTAIGSALADLSPVWLHRGEHFFDDTSAYSCAGAPLFGPDGSCVGMLDLTGIHVPERPALKHLVTQAAQRIENALTLAQPHHLFLRLNWLGRFPGGDSDGLVCLDADGHITGANRAAADMLSLPPGVPWPHGSEVFASPIEGLFDAARAQGNATEMPLWSGLRVLVLARLDARGGSAVLHRAPRSETIPLKEMENALIRRAVDEARGNVMQAARALGISRATVYRKLHSKKA